MDYVSPSGLKLRLTLLLTALIAALPFILVSSAHAQPIDGNKLVKARALTERDAWVAGETNYVGLVLDVSRGWHIYWRNAGGGMPTSWELASESKGITLGDATWPMPERYETDFSLDFVHEGRVMIMVPVQVDASLADQSAVEFEIKISWLVCKDICVPGEGKVTVKVPLVSEATDASPTRFAKLFEQARTDAPMVVDGDPAEMGLSLGFDSSAERITISAAGATELRFFPYENDQYVSPAKPKADLEAKGSELTISYAGMGLDLLSEVTGVLEVVQGDETKLYEITIPLK